MVNTMIKRIGMARALRAHLKIIRNAKKSLNTHLTMGPDIKDNGCIK